MLEPWRWSRFGPESGLPAGLITGLLEASDGVVWLLADDTLAWFDDYGWHRIEQWGGADPGRLLRIVAGSGGEVLVVTRDRRLFVGDRQGFGHRAILLDGVEQEITDAAPLGPGRLALLTGREFLEVGPTGTSQFPTPPPTSSPTSLRTRRLIRAESGSLWLFTDDQVYESVDREWIRRFDSRSLGLFEDQDGGLAVVETFPNQHEIWTWVGDAANATRLPVPSMQEATQVTAAALGPEGLACVAHASGSVWLRWRDEWQPMHPIPRPLSLPRRLLFQENGDLWVVRDRELLLCRISSRRWSYWFRRATAEQRRVHAMLFSSAGDFWVGTGDGLMIRRPDGETEAIRAVNGTPLRTITGLAEDDEGGVWVSSGASFEGAFRYLDGEWRHYGREHGLAAPRVHRIARDRRERLWFLGLTERYIDWETTDPGAFVLDEGRFKPWGPEQGLPAGRVYAFAEGPDGAYWFGQSVGLSRYRNGAWTHWTMQDGLLSNRVFAVAIGRDGRPWFAHQVSGLGLGTLDESERPLYLTEKDGLPDNDVTEIVHAPDGTFWLGMDGGVASFRDGSFQFFGVSSGLGGLNVWPVLPHGNQVLAGTLGSGISILDLSERDHPPPRVSLAEPIVTSDHFLSRWSVLAYRGEQPAARIETRHRIDDRSWSNWNFEREYRVDGLDAGEHTFTVQARGVFGQTGSSANLITFRVPVQFLDRPEVRVMFVILLLGLIAMAGLVVLRQRRQRRQVKEGERKLRLLAENIPGVVFTFVTGPGTGQRLEYVGSKLQELVGERTAEAVHRNTATWLSLVHADDRTHRDEAELRSRRTGGRFDEEYRVRTDWGDRWIRSISQPFDRDDGSTVWHGVWLDAHERRQAEEQRSQLEDQLRHGQKMQAIGQLAAGIAHEFNNLLVGILGNAELLLDRLRDESEHETGENLRGILASGEQAATLTRQLLTFSTTNGERSEQAESIYLDTALNGMTGMISGMVGESIRVDMDLRGGMIPVELSRAGLQQIVVNLALNSRDAMPHGGVLTIHTGPTDDGVILAVIDTGCGIEPRLAERIFEPFFTTRPVGQGTGLGLSIVFAIVSQAGGTVSVESRPTQGATFRIHLPRAATQPAELALEETLSIRGGDETILLCDDSPTVLEVMAQQLQAVGYEVLAAGDPDTALELALEQGQRIDLLLTDVMMPGIHGRELARRVQEIQPEIRLLYMSGYASDILDGEEQPASGTAFLHKPVMCDELYRAVRAVLGQESPV